MIEQLELIPETDVVHARWVGHIDAEKRHHLRKEIMKCCHNNGTKKFIVDLRDQIVVVSAKESYEFGRTFRREMIGFKLAIIVKKLELTEDIIKDTINRGDVIMETFHDFNNAFQWISIQ